MTDRRQIRFRVVVLLACVIGAVATCATAGVP